MAIYWITLISTYIFMGSVTAARNGNYAQACLVFSLTLNWAIWAIWAVVHMKEQENKNPCQICGTDQQSGIWMHETCEDIYHRLEVELGDRPPPRALPSNCKCTLHTLTATRCMEHACYKCGRTTSIDFLTCMDCEPDNMVWEQRQQEIYDQA